MIIVGGPPRSGTTLVQNILDMHADVVGAPEFLHFPGISNLRRAMMRNLEWGWLDEFCTQRELDAYVREFVGSFFEKLAGMPARYVSEKTPENVLCFRALADVFPGAKFINVVRDPRAIVASMLQVYRRAMERGVTIYPDYVKDAFKAIRYTKRCLQSGLDFVREYPGRAHTVKYEELLSNPESETRRLCEFLGIPWTEEMLRPSSKKHLGESAITKNSGEIWYDKKAYYRDPEKENIDKWRQTLSSADALLTAKAFAKWGAMDSLGYRFELNTFSAGVRIRVAAREAWHKKERIVKRLTGNG